MYLWLIFHRIVFLGRERRIIRRFGAAGAAKPRGSSGPSGARGGAGKLLVDRNLIAMDDRGRLDSSWAFYPIVSQINGFD